MAEKRMFTKKITESDAFLDLPMSTQCLYFHLNMDADDDGFVNNPKVIKRKIGASDDDLRLLIAKRFILVFDSGVIVIKHWRMHNTLKMDRYKPTDYQEEFAQLGLKDNKSYTIGTKLEPNWNQIGTSLEPQNSIEENRVDKNSIDKSSTRFKKPTLEEVTAYVQERGCKVSPQRFIDYYESNGWKVGRNPMKDWKACVRSWEQREKETAKAKVQNTAFQQFEQRDYTDEFYEKIIEKDSGSTHTEMSDEEFYAMMGG